MDGVELTDSHAAANPVATGQPTGLAVDGRFYVI
jgi:hypothetical protein